ncbi:MAG: carbohydrate binding family 9 domain-containing protein, partial [candidate division Zixibacteria bacterium]|nr:carbohydrate binding family 9 domain-containing protein [candidate division Zixibacteria bacterium]
MISRSMFRSGMGSLLFVFVLLLSATAVAADDDWTPIYNPTINIKTAPGEIKVDGYLNDPGWQGAAVADHFHENGPGDQIRPPVDTRAFITYNETHLFVSAVCYDNPDDLRAALSRRDRYLGDNIGFFFDTYGDAAWAYTLNVNPFGIQADALWSNGFGEDSMFDLVFESAGQVTDSGYQVEIAIPFASLRFPDKEKQTWRVQFWRHHLRESHYSCVWSAVDRNEAIWPNTWGTMTGLENVTPGKGVEIIPAITASQAGALNIDTSGALSFDNDDADGDLSLSGKYSISSNMIVDATYNPDFSNVESDAFQIDVNSPTALSYPEKRPFFQEGSDLYRTQLSMVYTRSINEPDFAAKFTGRLGRTSVSYLGAHDQNSPFIIPFEETSSGLMIGGESYSNILRVRQTIGSGSQVGFLLTDRHWEGGGSGTTFGLDAVIRLHQRVTLRTQVAGSHTEEPDSSLLTEHLSDVTFDNGKHTAAFDGESFSGYATTGRVSYNSNNFYIGGGYTETGPTFRADNGWVTRNSRRSSSLNAQYQIRFDEGLVERLVLNMDAVRIWNTDGHKKDEAIFSEVGVPLRYAQTWLELEYMISTEDFGGTYYDDIWNWSFSMSSQPSELLSFGGTISYGNQIAYSYQNMGRQTRLRGWADLSLVDRIFIENWYTHVKSHLVDTKEELFNGYIAGSRLGFQYNRRLSLRLLTQYNDFGKTWNIDPLITYQITPFSLFYIGTTYYVQQYDGLNKSGDGLAADDGVRFGH